MGNCAQLGGLVQLHALILVTVDDFCQEGQQQLSFLFPHLARHPSQRCAVALLDHGVEGIPPTHGTQSPQIPGDQVEAPTLYCRGIILAPNDWLSQSLFF